MKYGSVAMDLDFQQSLASIIYQVEQQIGAYQLLQLISESNALHHK
jgi:hypothetical protein